ncbi:hypothetical protein [Marisediminicola sp. LYQ134]|uniref:hypothetical protein n=1 Tax=unclassified Marisediminicola TaxID=2618316 RepID=UPI003983B3F3
MVKPTESSANRAERVLAYMLISIVALSLLSFLAVIFATLAGMVRQDFGEGVWPAITILPLFGLPIAFVMLIVLVVVSARRRARGSAG